MKKKSIKLPKVKISLRVEEEKLNLLKREYATDSVTDLFDQLITEKLQNRFQADATRSVITAIGGKNRTAKKIISLMPSHKIYIEPFANTASILLRKEPVKTEIYNDLDDQVSNFFQIIRDNPLGLYQACKSLAYSEQQYKNFIETPPPKDALQKAVRFFYLSRCSFLAQNKGFRTNATSKRNSARLYFKETERFYAVAQRFRNVEITNRDCIQVIKKYKNNPEVLYLCDPPYFDGTSYYTHAFSLKQHTDLANLLANIKGKAIVCHSKDEQIHKLYTNLGFRYEIIHTKYSSSIHVDVDGIRRRPNTNLYIYMNY